MRRGFHQTLFYGKHKRFVGLALGSDATTEHEIGIRSLQTALGLNLQAAPGVERRRVRRAASRQLRLLEGGDTTYLLYLPQDWTRDKSDEEKSQALARVERQDARLAKFEAARYLGAVGEKLTLEVRVTRIFTNEGQWGPTRTVLLRDAEGNYLRTGGSGKDLMTLKQGHRYRIAATVKAHSRFDLKLDDKTEESVSVRQTQLERFKVLEDLGAAA